MNQENNQEFQQNTDHEDNEHTSTEEMQTSNSIESALEGEFIMDGETSKNTIIIVVLAIIVIVLTLMYMWGSEINNAAIEGEVPLETEAQVPLPPDEQTEALMQVQVSDELEVIEQDLRATETNTLDADLDVMETELNAALAE